MRQGLRVWAGGHGRTVVAPIKQRAPVRRRPPDAPPVRVGDAAVVVGVRAGADEEGSHRVGVAVHALLPLGQVASVGLRETVNDSQSLLNDSQSLLV
jgi:hypothetical protein